MQVSDEQLEAMCRAYTDSKCATWEPSPAAMRAALAVLPDLTAERDQLLRDVAEWRDENRALHDSHNLALAERDQRSAELAALRKQHEWQAVRSLRDRLLNGAPAPEQPRPELRISDAEFEEAWRRASGPHRGIASRLDVRDALNAVLEERAPEQPASAERPASLREVWEAIEGLRESLETAWEVIELHERIQRELAGALEGSTATLHVREALRALDARKAGGR